MTETTHYGLTNQEYALRTGTHVSCWDKNAPYPLCGNGSYHAKVTRKIADVDCPVCLERIKLQHIK